MAPFKAIGVDPGKDMVATIEIRRPPHNFFDIDLIRQIADACEALDKDDSCRAIVLAAQGTAFCAGAKLGDGADVQNVLVKKSEAGQAGHLYIEAVRLFRTAKPMVGAIHGAAVGGGLGLALVPDLRVTCREAPFSASSTRPGFPPGFALTHPLPALIGPSRAALMFYTSRRVPGDEAFRIGLVDELVPQAEVRSAAQKLAAEIALAAPLGVMETRATLRAGLAERVRAATDIELDKQTRLRGTEDFKEGVSATNERRLPKFVGR